MFFLGADDDRGDTHVTHPQHVQAAQSFMTSCVCEAVLSIIHLLDDLEVNPDGVAGMLKNTELIHQTLCFFSNTLQPCISCHIVSVVAEKVVWFCLCEDPALFFRVFLEKITQREKQEELVFVLRKLLHHFTVLPHQTAHCLFNYLVSSNLTYLSSNISLKIY